MNRCFGYRRLLGSACLLSVMLVALQIPNCFGGPLPLPSSQELLAIYRGVYNARFSSLLFRINAETGLAMFVGDTTFNSLQSLTTGPEGLLYSWDGAAGLVTIDPVTGVGTEVDPNSGSGFTPLIQSLAFSPKGDLIGVTETLNQNGLYSINPSTGEASFIDSSPLPNENETIRGVEFLGDRFVGVAWNFNSPSSPYIEIDGTNGAVTQIGATNVEHLNSLAQDQEGRLYSVTAGTGHPSFSFSQLVQLDSGTGSLIDSIDIMSPEIAPKVLAVRGLTIRTVNPIPEVSSVTLSICFIFSYFVFSCRIKQNY